MKYLLLLLVFVSFEILADDNTDEQKRRDHGGPRFTDEQENCLKGILGEKGKGERPTREKMEAAFSKCGIEKPPGPPPHERGEMNSEKN